MKWGWVSNMDSEIPIVTVTQLVKLMSKKQLQDQHDFLSLS